MAKQKTGGVQKAKPKKSGGSNKVASLLGLSKYDRVKRRADKVIETLTDELLNKDAVLGAVEKDKIRVQIEVLEEVFKK